MKNSKLRRALLLLACAVMLVSLSVGATLAYLTSQTNTVQNSFSVGNVTLGDGDMKSGLDEGEVWDQTNSAGEKDFDPDKLGTFKDEAQTRVQKNTYRIVPGKTYDKDPTVHVTKGSEKCYVFVKVTNGIVNYEAADVEDNPNTEDDESKAVTIKAQILKNWIVIDEANGIYAYNGSLATEGVVDASQDQKDLVVFETFTIKGNMSDDEMKAAPSKTIDLVAYAVQAEGFGSAKAAWDATFGATNP